MRFEAYSFGSIRIDGVTYDRDVVIDHGEIRRRSKGPSKALRGTYGHTPLSAAEEIPWDCRRLVIGTGDMGALPILPEVDAEARRRDVELVKLPTRDAIKLLSKGTKGTNAILHLTC